MAHSNDAVVLLTLIICTAVKPVFFVYTHFLTVYRLFYYHKISITKHVVFHYNTINFRKVYLSVNKVYVNL